MKKQPGSRIALSALLVRAEEAADMLGLGRSTFYKHDARGLVPMAVRLGSVKRWNVAELQAWAVAGCPPRDRWETIKKRGS